MIKRGLTEYTIYEMDVPEAVEALSVHIEDHTMQKLPRVEGTLLRFNPDTGMVSLHVPSKVEGPVAARVPPGRKMH